MIEEVGNCITSISYPVLLTRETCFRFPLYSAIYVHCKSPGHLIYAAAAIDRKVVFVLIFPA